MTTMTSPTRPCVMNVFVPFSTQRRRRASRSSACAAASLPAVDSVSPHAPSFSPLRERHEIPLLLRVGAEHGDVRGAEPVVRRDRQRHRRDRPARALRCRCSSRWPSCPRRRTSRETECPSGQAPPASARAPPENAAPRPTRGRAGESRLRQTRERSAQELLLVTQVESSRMGLGDAARDHIIGVRAIPALQGTRDSRMRLLRLLGFSMLALAASAVPARAGPDRLCRRPDLPRTRAATGVSIGTGLLVLGFEFEYSQARGDDECLSQIALDCAPSVRTGMFNVLVQTLAASFRARSCT